MKQTLLLLLLLPAFCNAQFQDSHVISTSDNHITGSNGELSWTIGEPLVMTYAAGNDMLTEGYQQPLIPTNIIITEVEDLNTISTTAYPNPTVSGMTVQLSEELTDIQVVLFSVSGGKRGNWSFPNSSSMNIDLSSMPSGNYMLKLTATDYSSSIQIQKIN